MNDWISVKDKLPEAGEIVLIATSDWVILGKYKPRWGDGSDDIFSDDGDCGLYGQPSHWMPLPISPKA